MAGMLIISKLTLYLSSGKLVSKKAIRRSKTILLYRSTPTYQSKIKTYVSTAGVIRQPSVFCKVCHRMKTSLHLIDKRLDQWRLGHWTIQPPKDKTHQSASFHSLNGHTWQISSIQPIKTMHLFLNTHMYLIDSSNPPVINLLDENPNRKKKVADLCSRLWAFLGHWSDAFRVMCATCWKKVYISGFQPKIWCSNYISAGK